MPVSVFVVAASAGLVAGQTSRPDDGQSQPRSAHPRGLLAGPRVSPERGADEAEVAPDRRPVTLAPLRWYRLVQQLDLTGDQQRAIRAVWREYERKMQAYRKTHGPRVDRLSGLARQARADGGDLPALDRQELRRLQTLRPQGDSYQLRIWHQLDEPQQQRLRGQVAEARLEMTRLRRDGNADRDESPASGLDEAGRRRLRFLRSRRLESSGER